MSREASKEALQTIGTPEFRKEVSALVRARTPLVFFVSTEEKRLLEFFRHFAKVSGYRTSIWDCYNGLIDAVSSEPSGLLSGDKNDAVVVLDLILKEATNQIEASKIEDANSQTKGTIYVLLDFHRFIEPKCVPEIERRLRTLARMDANTTVFIVGPKYVSTEALDKDIRVLEMPLPNDSELTIAMDTAIAESFGKNSDQFKQAQENKQEIINAVTGMTLPEACSAFGKSLVMHKKMLVSTLLKEKQEIIKKTGVLEFVETDLSVDDIGGLSVLTDWLKDFKALFDPAAKEYGLPLPRGIILLGVSGGGKSLAAKATASLFNLPLLRLDFGALFGSYIGESEEQARKAIAAADALAPCVIGDTLIKINNQKLNIRDFFDTQKFNTNNEITETDKQTVVYLDKLDNYNVEGPTNIRVKAIIRTKYDGKLLKITTKSGKIIKVTPNHKFMINHKQKTKLAKDFKVGDSISVVYDNTIQGDIHEETSNKNTN